MADADIMKMKITRLIFLLLSAQTYCRLTNLIGPLVTCIKAKLFKTAEPVFMNSITIREMSLRERKTCLFLAYKLDLLIHLSLWKGGSLHPQIGFVANVLLGWKIKQLERKCGGEMQPKEHI